MIEYETKGKFAAMICLAGLFAQANSPAQAMVPQRINYQGVLHEGSAPADGLRKMRFLIFNAPTAGTALYDTGEVDVWVSTGVFRHTLTPSATVHWNSIQQPYIEMHAGIGSADTVFSPREPIGSAFYALYASSAETVVAGSLSDAHIAADAGVAPTKIRGKALVESGNLIINGPGPHQIASGVLGLGEANARYRLNVAGQLNATLGLCISGDCRNAWPAGAGTIAGSSAPLVGTIADNQVPRWYGSQFLGGTMIDNGSSVGIAKIPEAPFRLDVEGHSRLSGMLGIGRAPEIPYKLDVEGHVRTSGYYYGNGSQLIGVRDSRIPDGLHDNAILRWSGTGFYPGILKDNGMIVGIGKEPEAPYRLDVDGHLRVAGSFYGDGSHLMGVRDSRIGTMGANRVPKWNGSSLSMGLIYDDGLGVSIGYSFNHYGGFDMLSVNGDSYLDGDIDVRGDAYVRDSANVGRLRVRGSADVSGTVYAYSFSEYSDERLKQNVRTLGDALSKMLQLRGVAYEWKNPAEQGRTKAIQIGMIAQEVEKIFPEWVSTAPNDYKTVSYSGFEALAVEAIRVLHARNEALEARVRDMETRLSSGRSP